MRAIHLGFSTAFVTAALAAAAATASAEGISAGAGLAYGTGIEQTDGEIALQLNGYYDLGAVVENLRVGGAFNYFFVDDPVTLWTLNVNAQYAFFNQDALMVYGLAGINYARVSVDTGFGDFSDSEFGLNLGAGGELVVAEPISLYAELKYVLSEADQAVISLGGRYRF